MCNHNTTKESNARKVSLPVSSKKALSGITPRGYTVDSPQNTILRGRVIPNHMSQCNGLLPKSPEANSKEFLVTILGEAERPQI